MDVTPDFLLQDVGDLPRQVEARLEEVRAKWRAEVRDAATRALESSASPNDRMYSYGTGMLGVPAANTQAGRGEKELFDTVWRESFTKMQDEEIEKLIEAYLAAGQHTENEPRIAYPPEPEPESESLGAANQLPAPGNSGVTAGYLHSHSGAHDPDLWALGVADSTP